MLIFNRSTILCWFLPRVCVCVCVCVCERESLRRVRLFATPRTVAHQASLDMGFSMQGYWSGLPFPSPVDLPDPGIEPGSPALQADSLPSELPGKLPAALVFHFFYCHTVFQHSEIVHFMGTGVIPASLMTMKNAAVTHLLPPISGASPPFVSSA